MNKGGKLTGGLVAAFLIALFTAPASGLTLMQENLIDVSNRVTVVVADFEPDGLLTPEGVKSVVEAQLANAGMELVSHDSKPPLSFINVSVIKSRLENEMDYEYKLDINIYNVSTIKTKFELRKGTVWMIGSYRVKPGRNFPDDVELQLSRMVRYFIGDYYAANPNLN